MATKLTKKQQEQLKDWKAMMDRIANGASINQVKKDEVNGCKEQNN